MMKNISISRRIQLAIVLLLSGFFLAACKGHHEGRGGMMFDLAAYKLDLSEEQEVKWFAIRDQIQQIRTDMKKEKQESLEQVKALVLSDNLDQDLVLNTFDKHHDAMRAAAPSVIEKVAEFHATLTLEQKEKVAKMLERFASKKRGE